MSDTPGHWNWQEAFKSFSEKINFVQLSTGFGIHRPPYPQFTDQVKAATQIKLIDVCYLMIVIGGMPTDQTPLKTPINRFRILQPNHIMWLETWGFRPRSPRAVLYAEYVRIFQGNLLLPKRDISDRFYGHLVHCLLVEVEMLTIVHYFTGLGLARESIPLSIFAELSEIEVSDILLGQLGSVNFAELYGRPFVDLMAILIRAQWDKLTRLLFIAFDWGDWDSIDDGLRTVKEESEKSSPPLDDLMQQYVSATRLRLDKDKGWLRPFRDSLLHKTGRHSRGVVPQIKSHETTTDLWNRCLDEYDYLREAFFVVMSIILIAGIQNQGSKP